MTDVRRSGTVLLTILGLLLVAGAFWVSDGFYTIDEVVYVFGAETFLKTQSFFLENGHDEFGSRDLRWIDLLVHRTTGLTAQYPAGSAVFGAVLISAFDLRGILLFHAACVAGSAFVTRALAMKLFKDEKIALAAALLFLFGTFVGEYAYGLWPHAVSVLTVAGAFLWFLSAMDRDEGALRAAAISGLILGAGLLFRLDNLFLLPVIGLLTVTYAKRPVQVFLGGALGLLPAFVLLSLANQIKFGTFNPISYGHAGGDVGLGGYLHFAGAAAALFLALVVVRVKGWRIKPIWAVPVLVVAVVIAAVLLPDVQRLLARLYQGFVALFIDARTIVDPRGGVERAADGTLRFWGLPKKALGQSLPWLGVVLLLAFSPWGKHRRAIVIVLTMVALWSFPFVMRAWHGGLSLNMRYLMPLLPALSALCVAVIWQMAARLRGAVWIVLCTAAIGVASGLAWAMFSPSGISGAHQILSTYVLFAVALTALIAGLPRLSAGPVGGLSLGAAGVGIGLSLFLSASDLWISQLRRLDVLTDTTQGYSGKVIVYLHPFRSALHNPEQLVAVPHWRNGGPDADFVGTGIERGYRVLMPVEMAEDFVTSDPRFQLGSEIAQPLMMREIIPN